MKYQNIISDLERSLSHNSQYRSCKVQRILFDLSKDKDQDIKIFCLQSLARINKLKPKDSTVYDYLIDDIGVNLLQLLESKFM